MSDSEQEAKWSEEFDRLARFEQVLQHAFQGHLELLRESIVGDSSPGATWLRASLATPRPSDRDLSGLPVASRSAWQGWSSYYLGEYAEASLAFEATWVSASHPCEQFSGALGLSKIATRVGRWSTARDWALVALRTARRSDRLFDVVRGYGALGEILLRGGRIEGSVLCFGAARRLLPPGAGDRNRQVNYIATALNRIGDESSRVEAEHLLMTALRMAADRQDVLGSAYALARLQFLELDRDGNRDIPHHLKIDTGTLMPAASVALGFLEMGRGLAANRRQEREVAIHHAKAAASQFGSSLPMEKRWAELLISSLMNQPASTFFIPEVTLPVAPLRYGVIDKIFLKQSLEDDGFRGLCATQPDIAAVWHCRGAFFI